ncbi:MAG: hypothetical protein EBV77_09415 [Gemmatimonadaceae bacterium]|nr:hypothetical protein [Gemmatimonadaceae bacterium]
MWQLVHAKLRLRPYCSSIMARKSFTGMSLCSFTFLNTTPAGSFSRPLSVAISSAMACWRTVSSFMGLGGCRRGAPAAGAGAWAMGVAAATGASCCERAHASRAVVATRAAARYVRMNDGSP